MASGLGNTPSDVNNSAVVSEADPVLRQPPVLEALVNENLFATPDSSSSLLSDTANGEQVPLLGKSRHERYKPWYKRAAPRLLIPVALASALSRGITLAPRVEVFTQIVCSELRVDSDRMSGNHSSANYGFSNGLDQSLFLEMATVAHLGMDQVSQSLASSSPPLSYDTCRTDPAVQQGAAKLQTLVLTLAGILNALTSGFWGQFGDKHGRRIVISVSIFATLASDYIFILAASQSNSNTYSLLPASRLLVVSPIIEGLLGGFTTLQAALNAYISDTTPAGTSRAKVFARFFGFVFVGAAGGPALGNILPFNPFYSAVALGTANLVLVLLLLPESLTAEQRIALAANRALVASEAQRPENQTWLTRTSGYIIGPLRRAFEPMAILLPRKQESQGEAVAGYNWNLTYLAISLSLYLLTISIYSVKFLYAQHAFGWGGEQLSYYISFMGCIRALNLIVILPYLIKVYKPKLSEHSDSPSANHTLTSPTTSPQESSKAINTPATPSRVGSLSATALPSHPPSPQDTLPDEPSLADVQSTRRSIFHSREQQFDLLVARLSIAMDFWSYFLLCWATSATGFVLTTALSSFGGGTNPALQSLALGTLGGNEKDIGKLFGALSMLGAISSTILSPLIFGSLYSLTVAVFPKAIFAVATAILTVALVFLALVQPARPRISPDVQDFPQRDRGQRTNLSQSSRSG
ncbi:unnamed protein product [Rhizoctonia solani]|uniref:Uncharacterized protein n=1 Tax=Rhizoctonia solani TaxID=456999 RepID=A0A8H2WYF3_9AGAM|nr:unnamed protein product [Rhizoctonia solani]